MAAWYVQFIDGGALALASLLVLLGAAVLFFAWRRRERHAGLLLLAWGLMALSYPFWSRAAGVDSGATVGTVLIMLAAIVVVLANGDWRTKGSERVARASSTKSALEGQTAAPGRTRRTVLRTLAAGPLAFLAGLGPALLIIGGTRWPEADRIILGSCIMLIFWPAAMVWSCATSKPQRCAVALGVIALVSGVAVVPLSG
jgi:hypothetical protein